MNLHYIENAGELIETNSVIGAPALQELTDLEMLLVGGGGGDVVLG